MKEPKLHSEEYDEKGQPLMKASNRLLKVMQDYFAKLAAGEDMPNDKSGSTSKN